MNQLHLALHGLALKKHATPGAIAGIVGLSAARAADLLTQAVATGRAVAAAGAYVLSPAGRMILDGHYARIYAATRSDASFVAAYTRFERVNSELKQLITDWQTLDVGGQKIRNDHSNKAHDAAVLDRLGDLHERFAPILQALGTGVARLGVYAKKLQYALEQAEDAKIEWVSDAKIESYHTVWFEMHEDLLRILGRQRVE